MPDDSAAPDPVDLEDDIADGSDDEDRSAPDDADSSTGDPGPEDAAFEALVAFLAETRAFDFTGYKRPSLQRRVRHRMQTVGITSFDVYHDYLQANPDEFVALFNTILINVTSFFRDRESWEYLADRVLPTLLHRSAPEPIRVWSAGCSAGQEAYSLAIVLAEAIGVEAFRERVKIYATDVDEDALAYARQATYSDREMASVPAEFRDKYFDTGSSGATFRPDLRRSVIFGRNDLTRDAPISRIDLVTCRNTLMYLNAETQARVVGRLAFALRPEGVLFLGKAEMLLNHADTFQPIELKRRFFRRAATAVAEPLVLSPSHGVVPRRTSVDELNLLRAHALTASTVAQLVVDADGYLSVANARALELTGLSARDIGRKFSDLDLSFRPVELRPYLESARESRSPRSLRDVAWNRGPSGPGSPRFVDIEFVPMQDERGRSAGTLLVLTDVSRYQLVQDELEQATKQLQAASEELQSTNEELETTNEELQSTVEELETTNEELQSTNEELETMNEELQSMNDELQGANDELRERSAEVASLNTFMRSILGSMNFAVVVVDRELTVRVWNELAEDLWGVRTDEAVGTHLLNLDIGLPVGELRPLLRNAMAGDGGRAEMHVSAINRRGRPVELSVSVAPLEIPDDVQRGALVVMRPGVPTAGGVAD
ncbi:CheR family methyltransferase [Nakamurella endophytica]|uniref:protein-glutamate O-methyltransferase n=1 Tax=Nakamurella endophytica TaxID=1748367 RepID=A0A917T5N4_9ACTN|nr:CheR family methyltransferase [Nakamurella endophytica]GGM10662.1 chemotaxis protein CheR [Nakamurella endophytica]